ncbi:hypothetical protein J4416_02340 [Candidatus Pacearchaeota archaeon]|nr:hypothetical protein [Candidatus Pacearchaeota archaeon]
MIRDKSHMESVEKWAEFVRTAPRNEWKKVMDVFIDAVYEKADEFYKRLEETEKGREALDRLMKERMRVGS